jgi:hypothetical protein
MRKGNPFVILRLGRAVTLALGTLSLLTLLTLPFAGCAQETNLATRVLPKPMVTQIASWPAKVYGEPFAVRMMGNHAYVGVGFITENRGLAIFDVTYPGTPVLVSQSAPASATWGLHVVGRYAYLASSAGLQIIDVSDPRNPQAIGAHGTSRKALAVTVTGQYAYLLTQADFRVVDVSDPSQPALVSVLPFTAGGFDSPSKVVVHGQFAYLISGRVMIVDLTDPLKPKALPADARLVEGIRNIEFYGDLGYLAGTPMGIRDFADPRNPLLVGRLNEVGASDIKLVDNLLFAKTATALVGMDVSIATQPRVVSSYGASGTSTDLDFSGDAACIAQGVLGMQVVDLRNPSSLPVEVRE